MGKSGKLRKRRRLALFLAAAMEEVDSNDNDSDENGSQHAVVLDPLSADSIGNAVDCLEYFGRNLEDYLSPERKPVRACLYPLIEEQKTKSFNPSMKTASESANMIFYEEGSFDLCQAIATFQALAERLDVFRSKDMKSLRRALHPIVVQSRSLKGLKDQRQNVSGEISDAMNLRHWEKVLNKVIEMKLAKEIPKLGALQRWVRQCGDALPKELAIFLLSRIIDLTASTSLGKEEIPRLQKLYHFYVDGGQANQLTQMPAFKAPHRRNTKSVIGTIEEELCVSTYSITKDNFIVDSCVLGKDRRPPSAIDMNIYRSKSDVIVFDRVPSICVCTYNKLNCSLDANPTTLECRRCHGIYKDLVTGVDGAILLSNVLSPKECGQLIYAAEMLGYYDDAVEGIEALVWIADETLLRPVFDRCKHLLPQNTADGKTIAGINPRLRFFRYGQNAVYRPHIDGSWTANGAVALDAEALSELHSYYTFLIYLNDNFEGGETTFFVSPSTDAALASDAIISRSVEPVQGSILCFPHGIVEGSLVHEGSAVTTGTKYVIRTDLLYY